MGPEIILIIFFGFFLVMFVAVMLTGNVSENSAWKSTTRFVVRQQLEHGVTREWICARYTVITDKIHFRQQGHKHNTVVAGHWHVEPILAS